MESGLLIADATVGRPSWKVEENVITASLQSRKGRWEKGQSRGPTGRGQLGLKEAAVSQRRLVTTRN